jgi:ADP-ribose pyrophosphatase
MGKINNRNSYYDLMQRYPKAFENPVDPKSGIHIVTDSDAIDTIETEMGNRLSKKGLSREWAEVGMVYRDQYSTILRDAVYFQPGNYPGTYVRRFTPDDISGVVILPEYKQSICMIRIFRHALRRYVLEVPRGFSEPGLTPLQNAEKELKEEIGGKARNIHELGYMVENSGMGNAKAALFYADLEDVGAIEEDKEGIQKTVFVPKPEFTHMIESGVLEDSFTLCAALRAIIKGYLTDV